MKYHCVSWTIMASLSLFPSSTSALSGQKTRTLLIYLTRSGNSPKNVGFTTPNEDQRLTLCLILYLIYSRVTTNRWSIVDMAFAIPYLSHHSTQTTLYSKEARFESSLPSRVMSTYL